MDRYLWVGVHASGEPFICAEAALLYAPKSSMMKAGWGTHVRLAWGYPGFPAEEDRFTLDVESPNARVRAWRPVIHPTLWWQVMADQQAIAAGIRKARELDGIKYDWIDLARQAIGWDPSVAGLAPTQDHALCTVGGLLVLVAVGGWWKDFADEVAHHNHNPETFARAVRANEHPTRFQPVG